jgi:3-methyladenine DNA glycosylase AlkD
MSTQLTAKKFISELIALRAESELKNVRRFFRDDIPGNEFIGVRMGHIFTLAKKFQLMPLTEVVKLLKSKYYEARVGAVSIMDFKARAKRVTPEERSALYKIYIGNHDKINNWDMVDRAAPHVVGGYLFDKDRKPLNKLAKSRNVWERRTAIVATWYFIRQGEVSDTFRIAGILIHDQHDLIQKAVGSWIREAGKRDKLALLEFLDEHVATMPAVTLRYATEKLDKKLQLRYRAANAKGRQ